VSPSHSIESPLEQCRKFDIDVNDRMSVDELVPAVNSTLPGCASLKRYPIF
jgi:hypothetical protein